MPSSYSTSLRLTLQATGENNATWGTQANTVFSLLEQAVTGVAAVFMTDANYTLTASNGASDEARCHVLNVTGTLTASRNVIVPTVAKQYVVYNATTGSQTIVVKTSAGTGITIPNGKKRVVYCDGTNVVDTITDLPSGITIGGSSFTGTFAQVANNLSDLANAGTARTNLGLGTMAVETATDYLAKSGNLSGLASASTSRTNLGLGTMAVETATDYCAKSGNLSGLSSASTARTNLGLGTMATQGSSAVSITGGTISGSFTGSVTWDGTVTGGSDQRLKSDIEDLSLDEAISFVKSLRPRTFLKFDEPQMGFVAQEIQDDRFVFDNGDILSIPVGAEWVAPVVKVLQHLLEKKDH